MKRCPECGREYNNTMSFCLDDGAELLYVPASDESAAPSSSGTGSRLQAAHRRVSHGGGGASRSVGGSSGDTAAGTSGDCKRL